jgi:hypothetical protein
MQKWNRSRNKKYSKWTAIGFFLSLLFCFECSKRSVQKLAQLNFFAYRVGTHSTVCRTLIWTCRTLQRRNYTKWYTCSVHIGLSAGSQYFITVQLALVDLLKLKTAPANRETGSYLELGMCLGEANILFFLRNSNNLMKYQMLTCQYRYMVQYTLPHTRKGFLLHFLATCDTFSERVILIISSREKSIWSFCFLLWKNLLFPNAASNFCSGLPLLSLVDFSSAH